MYRQAIEAEPENAMAYNDFGLCLARQDRHEEAATILRRAAQLEPTRKLYHNNLATVLVELDRTDEAWNVLKQAHPTGVAHYNLGYLLHRQGNSQACLHHFTLAWQEDQTLAVAKDMIDQLSGPSQPSAPQLARANQADDRSVPMASPPIGRDRVEAKPAGTVLPPAGVRRIPATGSVHDYPADTDVHVPTQPLAPSDEPSVRLMPPAEDVDRKAAPMRYPIQRMSGVSLPADLEDMELPTPRLLND